MKNDAVNFRVTDGEAPNTRKVTFEFNIPVNNEMTDKAFVGKKAQVCKICGASGDFQTWVGIEMFFGTGDEFNYFICPECETLQIEKIPQDIGKYYPDNYYSYSPPQIRRKNPDAPTDARMILDVGCGAGNWLCGLAENGCVNLYGCDPFIQKDIEYPNGVKIKKCSIHEMKGEYDLISFRSSFEHMPDPHDIFRSLNRLLKNGTVQILIPVFPNLAFDIYGPFWYQMDPPRHFFLYSRKSIGMLAEQNGFKITEVSVLGYGSQFTVSRGYQLGVPFTETKKSPEISRLGEDSMYETLSHAALAGDISDTAMLTLVRK